MVAAQVTADAGSSSKVAFANAPTPLSRKSPPGCCKSQSAAPAGSSFVQCQTACPIASVLPLVSG